MRRENPQSAMQKQSYARDLEEQIRLKQMQKEKEKEEQRRFDEKFEAEWRSNQALPSAPNAAKQIDNGAGGRNARPQSPMRKGNNFYSKNSGPPPFGVDDTNRGQNAYNPPRSQSPRFSSYQAPPNAPEPTAPLYPYGMQATLQFPASNYAPNPNAGSQMEPAPSFPTYNPPIYAYESQQPEAQVSAISIPQSAYPSYPTQSQPANFGAAPVHGNAGPGQGSSRGKSQYQLELEAQIREREMKKQREKEEKLMKERREEEEIQKYWQTKDDYNSNLARPHPSQQSTAQPPQLPGRRGVTPTNQRPAAQAPQAVQNLSPAEDRTAPANKFAAGGEEPRFVRFRTDPNKPDQEKGNSQTEYQRYLQQQIEEKRKAKEMEKKRQQMEDQMEEARFYEQQKAEREEEERRRQTNQNQMRQDQYTPSSGRPLPGQRAQSPAHYNSNQMTGDGPPTQYQREVGRARDEPAESRTVLDNARERRGSAPGARGGSVTPSNKPNPLDEWHSLRKELEIENDKVRQKIAQSRAFVQQNRQVLMQPPPTSFPTDPILEPAQRDLYKQDALDLRDDHPFVRMTGMPMTEDKSLVSDSTFVYPEETSPPQRFVSQRNATPESRPASRHSNDVEESPLNFPPRTRSGGRVRRSGDYN